MRAVRTERWWWLGGFLLLSILIHILLALHGPGFGLQSAAPLPKEIELTLAPPEKKPPVPKKIAAHLKPLPKTPPRPRLVAKRPERRPVPSITPQLRVARVTPKVTPAASPRAQTIAPEKPTEPVKMASATPHISRMHSAISMANPLANLVIPEDKPETLSSPSAETPKIARANAARSGLAGGASGGGQSKAHGPQTPTDLPQDTGLAGGMHFPKMAAHIGGEAIMSVKNPLAEDAVPEDKPGFSQGAGGSAGLGQGRGHGGLNGKLLASLRGGHGPGLGGGIGGGHGAGSGHGSGRGRGAGHGTGSGASGSGDADGVDLPAAVGNGYGNAGTGQGASAGGGGHHFGSGHLAAGGLFGGVGGLLHGEPTRAPGDGHPGTNGHGLTAEVYEGNPYLTRLVHNRTDAAIDFNWGMVTPVVKGVSRIFSVRWTGKIEPQYSEMYTFATEEDDGLRLWVDGRLLVNDWKDHMLTARHGSIRLEAGRKYDIRVEYFNGADHAKGSLGHAEVHLRWSSASQPLETVPESALWQAG